MKKFKENNYDVTNRTTTTKTQTPFSTFRKLHRWETGLLQEIYHNLWIDVSIFSINLSHDLTDSLILIWEGRKIKRKWWQIRVKVLFAKISRDKLSHNITYLFPSFLFFFLNLGFEKQSWSN